MDLAPLNEVRTRVKDRVERLRDHVISLWNTFGLRTKLSLLFASLLFGMASLFYVFTIYETTKEIKINAIQKGQVVGEALKSEAVYALDSKSFPNLSYTFRRLVSSRNDIVYAMLLDPQGRVLAHSTSDLVDALLSDPLTQRAIAAHRPQYQFLQDTPEGTSQVLKVCDVSVPVILRGRRQATLRVGVSITDLLASATPRVRRDMIFFMVPFLMVGIGVAYKLAGSFIRPLRQLVKATSELAKGNFDLQVPFLRQDEIGDLAQSFQTMAHQLKQDFTKITEMANRDGLTGLYNARFFLEAFDRELARAQRVGKPLSLVILDADHFKRLNDRRGHQVGDIVLQHIARLIRGTLRNYDLLARYGGEEFIALLTDTAGTQAFILAERLRKTVEQRPYVTEEGEALRLTISLGVSEAPPHDKKDLIAQADQALYRAKETGRNKTILFRKVSAQATPLDTRNLELF